MYPIELPAVCYDDLTSASEQHLSSLESRTNGNEWFESPHASKVAITGNNVRRLHMFEDNQLDCTLLALHPADDGTQVVAVYLYGKWWSVNEVLRTSSKSRAGLVLVQSVMERVILFLLSQIVDRLPREEALFSPHPRTEFGKLLWRDGEAVGFYTVKKKGSLCGGWTSQCYLLPVLDTVLVRRRWRRRGLGLQMLEDFCSSFSREEVLGVSSPLSPSMVGVCRRFLQLHEEHRERLYEVEAPGGWTQRRNIWLKMQLDHYSNTKEEHEETSGETVRNEGDATSQKQQPHAAGLDVASSSNTCTSLSSRDPLLTGSRDPSKGGNSPSGKSAGTGRSRAAHAGHPDIGPSPGLPKSPNGMKDTQKLSSPLTSKSSGSSDPLRPRPQAEETLQGAKRVRRTLD